MKLTEENKIEIYNRRKRGETIVMLSSRYNIQSSNIKYRVGLIDMHGIQIVQKTKNKKYSKEFKLDCINRVLISGESVHSVALDVGLSSNGQLFNWIRSYKENGYNIIEKKRGCVSMKKSKDKLKSKVEEIEVERLKKEIEYLKAENEFLKKWNAVVQLEERRKKKK